MDIEMLPHLDEIYIRRYDAEMRAHAYHPSVVDVPMTLRVANRNFSLTCRRDVDGNWVAFCNERERARLYSCFYAFSQNGADEQLKLVLTRAVKTMRAVVNELPDPLTRRDALERMIKTGDAKVLLERDLEGLGHSLKLCCLPSLEIVIVVWNETDNSARDTYLVSATEWQSMGLRIEELISFREEEALKKLLVKTVYPFGFPPSLMGVTDYSTC
ncbi:MAG: hypothetical protein LW629_03200 [Burkholderiales bacterium]|jgi:hypothetical protein|nr:hypothetical protein [Burkholderiales bacterium]